MSSVDYALVVSFIPEIHLLNLEVATADTVQVTHPSISISGEREAIFEPGEFDSDSRFAADLAVKDGSRGHLHREYGGQLPLDGGWH